MNKLYINYKSDFRVELLIVTDWNSPFTLQFWTTGLPNQRYIASFDGHNNYVNCYKIADNRLMVTFDDHHLGMGELIVQATFRYDDNTFRTGIDDQVMNAVNVTTKDPATGGERDIVLALRGESELTFKADLPMVSVAEQEREASEQQRIDNETARTEAEQSRSESEQQRNNAEQQREASEQQRIDNETARNKAEQKRDSAEQARETAEQSRQSAEQARETAEQQRIIDENQRASSERQRNTSESARQLAEETRQTDESARIMAERQRVSAENERNESEQQRTSSEQSRVMAEQERIATEQERGTAEQSRSEAEQTRRVAEQVRIAGEQERGTAEQQRSEAEQTRKQSEQQRTVNETSRNDAEQEREVAEQNRIFYERQRNNAEQERAEAEQDRADAEAARNDKENNRIAAETERKVSETERESAETRREAAEIIRNKSEQSRVAAEQERIDNEEQRTANERTRIHSEEARNEAETVRDEAEQMRNVSESTRKEAEQSRVAAEQERIDNEEQRTANEQERTNSELARNEAEQKREVAESDRAGSEAIRNAAEMTRQNDETARKEAEQERQKAEAARVEATAAAIEMASHPDYIGDDNFVYRYDTDRKKYVVTDIYVKGDSGKSAYKSAIDNGFDGTEQEWLDSLHGKNGKNGKSAYEVAIDNGFDGTEQEWLDSLHGENGENGKSAYEVAIDNGFDGTEQEWLDSLHGENGENGKSAYEVAIDNGFDGTEQEWLESLHGKNGDNGSNGQSAYELWKQQPGNEDKTEQEFLASLKEISDYETLMVESRPENPQIKIIYGIPAADGQSWTEEFWDGAKWVVLRTHNEQMKPGLEYEEINNVTIIPDSAKKIELKDKDGNPMYVMSHSDAIKMADEDKTLTEKIKGFEGFKTIQVQGNTRCLHVSSGDGVQNSANAFVVWEKLDYDVVLKKITCSFDYQGVKRCVIVIADYTGDMPVVSASYNIQMEQDQTEMNLEEMNIVVPKNHVVAFGVERLLSNGSWVKTIRRTYATFKGLKFVPSSGGYGSYPVYSIGSRATYTSDFDSVFAIFDYEGVKSVKEETGYIENGSIGDDKKAVTALSSNPSIYYQCFEDSLPYDAHVDSILLNKENVDNCSLESLWFGIMFALNGSVIFSRMYLWSRGEYEIPIDVVIPKGAVLMIRCVLNNSPFKFYNNQFAGCYVTSKFYPGTTVSYGNASRVIGARLKYHRVLNEEDVIGALTKTSTTYADMTSVALFGSSLTWCGFSPKGLSWVERLNDIVDVNIANFGTSGSNFIANIRGIVNDDQYGKSLKALAAKWFCFNNTANGTGQESGEVSPEAPKLYHSQMHQALEVTKAFGAKMIMGGEDSYTYDPLLLARNIKSYCRETDTPMSLTGVLYSLLYRKNKPYAGFYNGHGGYRTSSIMMIHEELFKHLYIKKSVKMFKIREGFVESVSSASDLNYTTVWERNKKWRSLCCGVGRFYTTAQADNIDGVGTTDSQKTIADITKEDEVLAMKKGRAVTFYNYALCEFILDKVQITKGKFTIETPSTPSHIYVARNVNNSFASVFEETSFTYEDGKVTVVLEGRDIELYDKVKIVIANDSSSFVLSKPTFEDYDGVEKDYKEFHYHPRCNGEELNPKTSCEGGWTMGGNASVKQLPASMANYPGRNSVKAHIQLETDGDSCAKTFDIQRCSKVAIRIDATLMPKIATKRFAGTSDADSEYVTTTDTVAPCEWLNGDLIVTVNGYAFQTGVLQPWWFEHYFEFDIEPDDESITIKIERHTEQNGSTRPVLIHNVSVQKIR